MVMNRVAVWSLVLACIGLFFLPISIGLSNFLILGAVVSLFAGQWSQRMTIFRQYHFVWLAVVFVIFTLCAAFWNEWSVHAGLMEWKKYTYKIVVALLLLPFLAVPKWRLRALWSILLGTAVITVILSVLRIFHLPYSVVLTHIWHHAVKLDYSRWSFIPLSVLVSLFAYALLLLGCQQVGKARMYHWLGALWFYIYLFCFNPKRTGMVCALVLLVVFALQKLRWRWVGAMLVAIIVLVGVLYHVSPVVHKGITHAEANIVAYQKAEQNHFTSDADFRAVTSHLGFRFYAVHLGSELFWQKPWFVYGSGSFSDAFHSLHDPFLIRAERTYFGDHDNAYLYIAVQWGVVGLLIFFAWMVLQFYEARHLPETYKHLDRALIINLLVANLFSSAFWEHISIFSFLMLTMIFYSPSLEAQAGVTE